jgi:hypothetical protein
MRAAHNSQSELKAAVSAKKGDASASRRVYGRIGDWNADEMNKH